MKKWVLVAAGVLIAALVSVYVFIPAELNIIQITPVKCTQQGAYRHLATADKWKKWWPAGGSEEDKLSYQQGTYQLTKTLLNAVNVHIQHQDLSVNSVLHVFPLPGDSAAVEWKCQLVAGSNPVKRIRYYQQALTIKNNLAALLASFKTFAEKKENIYGIKISESFSIKDTALIATKATTVAYPTVKDMYASIQALQKFSWAHQAKQTGSPILNITPSHPSGFEIMIALPVNKELPDTDPFFKKRILPARFLFSRVQGGQGAVEEAFAQLQWYVLDYRKVLMTIPFQQLITDRLAEPDSTKWVTDIYMPVF